MIKRILNDGISIQDGNIILNTDNDLETDIMNVLDVEIYESDFGGNIYFFGYQFNSHASRNDRTLIINWLKGLGTNVIDDKSLRKFVRKPLLTLNQRTNLATFDCMLYPRSGRSNLTRVIVNEIYKLTPHDLERSSFELIKNLPQTVEFDWKAFNADYEGEIGDNQYNQIRNYIEGTLMPKIHDLSYFSIASNVKYKYRPYIQNYLHYENEETKNIINSIQNGKILIVDDINTSGSTLTEILRLVHSINNDCEIYIFTLIGKD